MNNLKITQLADGNNLIECNGLIVATDYESGTAFVDFGKLERCERLSIEQAMDLLENVIMNEFNYDSSNLIELGAVNLLN